MPVMYIGHVSVLMFGPGMLVFVGMSHVRFIMRMEFIMAVSVLVYNRHVDVKMGMFFVRQ